MSTGHQPLKSPLKSPLHAVSAHEGGVANPNTGHGQAGTERYCRWGDTGSKTVDTTESVTTRLKQAAVNAAPWYSEQMQLTTLVVWAAVASTAAALLLRQLDENSAGLFYLYFQPLVPVAAMLWAWASTISLFERRSIQYGVCFSLRDQQRLISSPSLYYMAALVSSIVASNAACFAWLCWRRQFALAAWQPLWVYCALAGLLVLPIEIAHRDTRSFLASTLARVITPFREVSWADFLLADFLTSLAKPLGDGERAVCHLMTGSVMDPTSPSCSGSSWLATAAWAAPFVWRFCQCLRVYNDLGSLPQLWNALKYATAFPGIVLSGMKNSAPPAEWASVWQPLWVAAYLVNSSFSYFWDVERDWEISWFTNTRGERSSCGMPRPSLRDDLFFSRGAYVWLMASNAVLRLAWLHKLVPSLAASQGAGLCFVLLEVYRRAQWAPVRVEVELRKLQAAQPELGRLVPPAARAHDALQNGISDKSFPSSRTLLPSVAHRQSVNL